MKKTILLLLILSSIGIMQAQNRSQPKPGKAPLINLKKPQTFELANGLKVIIVEDYKLPRVTYSLTLDNPPFLEGNKKGVDELTSNLLGNGSKKISKDDFNEEIDFLGANLNFSSSGAFAGTLSKHANRVLELMVEGALNPKFTQEEFDKEKAKMIESLRADEKNIKTISNRVTNALAFGKNHPFGEFLTAETLNAVSLADVQNNYNNYFTPENAFLVVIGDIKLSNIKPVIEKLFGSWEKKSPPKLNFVDPTNVNNTQINFIDMPNAVQSEIVLTNTLNLKMNDPDFFPASLAAYILGGNFNSYLNMNLREKNAWTYGANTSIGSDKYVSAVKSTAAVRNMVTDSAVVEFIKEFKKIRNEKVDNELLENVKASFIGRFVMNFQKPQSIARYALNIETQKLPKNFYENYIKNINAITPEQIQQAANKYFLIDNTRIVITGKGSEVLPNLEKLQLPIFHFDKFGNPLEKPALKKEVPAHITAKTVLENYIKVIGGEKAVAAVKSITMMGSTNIPQAPSPLTFINKIDDRGKMLTEVSMGPMSMMKQVINEKEAYIIQQGKRKNIEGQDLVEIQSRAIPFIELKLLNNSNIKLVGIESINGNEAYALQNDKITLYYDLESGLKVAESKTIEKGKNKIQEISYFEDYKEVKGVKIPFTIILNPGIELNIKMSEIKINEEISENDIK